jgi:hypothetical protein
VLVGVDLAVADDHVGGAREDRRDQLGDVGAVVLVVRVGVDDHVGAQLEPRVQSGLEAGGQPLVVGQADDVVDAVVLGDLDRVVGRAVVDDQPFDRVEPLDRARELGERGGELLLLVVTGNLDDELHGHGARFTLRRAAARAVGPLSCCVDARALSHGSGILIDEHGRGNGKQARATPALDALARRSVIAPAPWRGRFP